MRKHIGLMAGVLALASADALHSVENEEIKTNPYQGTRYGKKPNHIVKNNDQLRKDAKAKRRAIKKARAKNRRK